MLYFENQSRDPFFNQALEEYVFEQIKDEVLLLWRNEPTLVCGRYQNIFAEVDIQEAQRQGVRLVRRMTGGGTVFHDPGNINYAIIRNHPNQIITYDAFLEPMIHVLQSMGVPAEPIPGNGLGIGGKKISGSAQRCSGHRTLHHGTLLYDTDLNRLARLANGHRRYFSSRGTPSVPWLVTNIQKYLAGDQPVETFQEQLLTALKQHFSVTEAVLMPQEQRIIQQLAKEKYENWEWTFGRNPGYGFSRNLQIQGQDILAEYEAKNGRIARWQSPDPDRLAQRLEGSRLHPADLLKALDGTGYEELVTWMI